MESAQARHDRAGLVAIGWAAVLARDDNRECHAGGQSKGTSGVGARWRHERRLSGRRHRLTRRATPTSECSSDAESSFDHTLKAPAEVRTFVHRSLCRQHANRIRGPVRLAASEYSTEAALQGEGPFAVRLTCNVSTVTVSVVYTAAVAVKRPDLEQPSKISYRIIDNISLSSGREVDGREHTLWCTVPTGYVPA